MLEIEDLILVVEPEVSNASEIEKVLTKEETFQVIGHLMKNYKNLLKGKKLDENPYLESFEKEFLEQRRNFIYGPPAAENQGDNTGQPGEDGQNPKPTLTKMPTKQNIREQNEKNNTEEGPPPNVFGPELYELVFGRLDFKIKINNVKIYYENDHSEKNDFGNKVEFQKSFSIMFNIKGLSLTSVRNKKN